MKIVAIPRMFELTKAPVHPVKAIRVGHRIMANHKFTKGPYVVPVGEQRAADMTENNKKGKVTPRSYYLKKRKQEKLYIEFTNAAGRIVKKLAP